MTDQPTNGAASPGAGVAATGNAVSPSALAGGESSSINFGPTFTPEQLRSMADDLVGRGVITREQANESLAADGVLPEAASTDYTGLSSEAEAIDQAFSPAKPEEYEIPPPDASLAGTKEYTEFDKAARGWLSEARVPREIGSAIAKAADETARVYPTMSPDQRSAYAQAELAKLRNVYGAQTEAKVALAKRLVREIAEKSPGVIEYLNESGAGANAMVVMLVAEHAERLAARLKS